MKQTKNTLITKKCANRVPDKIRQPKKYRIYFLIYLIEQKKTSLFTNNAQNEFQINYVSKKKRKKELVHEHRSPGRYKKFHQFGSTFK